MRTSKRTWMVVAMAGVFAISLAAQQQGQTPPPAGQGQPPGAPPPQGRGRGPQQPPKNLQVLPKDMTTPQVVQLMRTFTTGLGVMCDYCHVSLEDRA